jgi:C6 transcription factor Pro1
MGMTYADEDPNDIINPLSPEYASIPLLHPSSDDLVTYYMEHVLKIQFLLMDQPWLQYMMHDCISRSTTAFVAVRLLAELHRWCLQNKGLRGNPDIVSRRKALFHELTTNMYPPGSDGRGEAVAALQLVSSYLFVGGSGEWQSSLGLSCEYAKAVLRSSAYANASDALLKCHHIQRFVIKTSMWFDVLASASQLTKPYFLEEYRELFDPSNAHFDAPPPEELDMIAVMGCSNRIVWAMAEITNLACWKANSHAQGRPSTVGLMEKANDIQKFLMIRGPISKLTGRNDVQGLRDLTSEVFRSSALVYLHSVISGDYPSCPEIQMNVHSTIKLLELIPDMSETTRSVTRCVVFCIFICGCLTGDKSQRDYLINRLAQQNDKPVGNCSRVQSLLKQVWDEWDRDPRQPVRWRKVLKDPSMLLV